jgi:hypothetical protein
MNELEFKHHLKDLAHGHHHTEEHDWASEGGAPKTAAAKAAGAKPAPRKTAKTKSTKKK